MYFSTAQVVVGILFIVPVHVTIVGVPYVFPILCVRSVLVSDRTRLCHLSHDIGVRFNSLVALACHPFTSLVALACHPFTILISVPRAPVDSRINVIVDIDKWCDTRRG
jgi:hypothetical protein